MSAFTQTYPGRALLARILREHLKPYRWWIVFSIVCMVTIAGSQASIAWLIKPALDLIFIARDESMLTVIPLALLAAFTIGALANYGNTLSMRFVGTRIVADMQVRLFDHLMKSDVGLFSDQSSGRLISRFTNDITLLRHAFSSVLTTLARETLTLVFLVGVMIARNPELALLAFLVYPVAIYPTIRLSKRMRRVSDSTQVKLGDFTATLDEVFKGVRTVKSYNREGYESQRAKSNVEALFRLYYKGIRIQAAAQPMMEVLAGVSIALIVWYGGSQVLSGEATTGEFSSFVAAFIIAYRPARAMSGLNTVLQEGMAAADRLFTVIDTPPAITDRAGAKELALPKGHIRFENVSFRYAPGAPGVENISLEVPAGKTAALVGLSGGGKSTLMNLLLRFYEVGGGSITIDGQDIRDVTLASLRAHMAFVPQEPMLFDDTIRANIAYGRENAGEEEIVEAAKNAAADEFIRSLPEGYGTLVGSHGLRLSGGQRQRVAIARAMLKNVPILLLDEATSSLDSESERSIQQALARLMKGRTTLVVAHRLSTIVDADIIYVVEAGRIIESGTHQSLMAAQGKYHQLYAQNFESAA